MKESRINGTKCLIAGPEDAKALALVIPGNPGVCDFYDQFLESLADRVPGVQFVVSSHLGFDGSRKDVVGLMEQIDHQIQVVQHLKTPGGSIAILGHSVGAWLGQRVAARLAEKEDVVYVGLLAPTIAHIALSERGRVFTRISWLWPLVVGLVWLINLLPEQLITTLARLLLRRMPPKHSSAAISLAKSPLSIRQVIVMAREEMVRISNDWVEWWAQPPARRVQAVFALHDHWVSPVTREALCKHQRLPFINMSVIDVPHAWCLFHSEEIADAVAPELNEALSSSVGQAATLEPASLRRRQVGHS